MTTFVLSAGGTGGHLFPAQAVAEELARRGHEIVVMTDNRGSHYAKAFPGARIETIPSGTFASRAPLQKLKAVLDIARGILKARLKLAALKPAAVIGFGGYPSLPVMLAAGFAKYPSAILEQNTVLGRVNRLIAKHVSLIAAAFPIEKIAPAQTRIIITGNPVRPEVLRAATIAYTPPQTGHPIDLLIFGGSQGARAFSQIIPAAMQYLPGALRHRLRITQQCRSDDLEQCRALYERAGMQVKLASFFADLPQRLALSHLVIARSGAGTIAELAAIGRPAILVPLPGAMDDHQTSNAKLFAATGAGWLLPQKDLTAQSLATLLIDICAQPDDLAKRAAAATKLARPDAAHHLADVIEKLGEAV